MINKVYAIIESRKYKLNVAIIQVIKSGIMK